MEKIVRETETGREADERRLVEAKRRTEDPEDFEPSFELFSHSFGDVWAESRDLKIEMLLKLD